MSETDRPWLGSYDEGLGPEVEIPDYSLVDRIDEMAQEYADRPAFRFLGRTWTYAQFIGEANRFANALIAASVLSTPKTSMALPVLKSHSSYRSSASASERISIKVSNESISR